MLWAYLNLYSKSNMEVKSLQLKYTKNHTFST